MKKVLDFLIAMALARRSSDSIASEKQTERKVKLSKEKIALVAVSALAVVSGVAFVKAALKNNNLIKLLENAQKESESKQTRISELEALRLKLAGQIEAARDAEEKTIAKFLNGISSAEEVEYSDDFVKQIEKIIANKKPSEDYYDPLMGGNLQEIVWRLREHGDTDAADKIEKLLTSALQEEEIVKVEKTTGGKTELLLLTFKNGMRGVFKRHANWEGIAMYVATSYLALISFP